MRIGLGCMRLSTEPDRDEATAVATIDAALEAGFVVLDTAHAYGLDERDLGHNERLLGRAVRARLERGRPSAARVITKCGMGRQGGAWVPDGRASTIAQDARASVDALGGVPIDVLLLHAPDPRTSLATAARALAKVHAEGLARQVGVSNVSRRQLEEVLAHVPVSAVEVALGAYDDLALRSGVVAYCIDNGIEVFAHAPLGGPARVGRLGRDGVLRRAAAARGGVTPIEVFLAYLLAVRPELVPIVGARRVETVESLVRAAHLALSEEELAALDARFPVLASLRRPARPSAHAAAVTGGREREVVMMMGVPGAGKSRAAEALVTRGYERLNRDSLGGTLRGIVKRLDERLSAGADRIVLDNTYVTRATRHDVVRIASAHGVDVRCVFFDTPSHEANINVVNRMLDRFGEVLGPVELALRSRHDPAALSPSAVHRMKRDLEPPAEDEGFASIATVTFTRDHAGEARAGLAVALDALGAAASTFSLDEATLDENIAEGIASVGRVLAGSAPGAPLLIYAWRPQLDEGGHARAARFAAELGRFAERTVEIALCTHPPGPPVCWCRPPLPGMWLAFARRHHIDVRASTLMGASPTDAAMAQALGLRFEAVGRRGDRQEHRLVK